MSSKLDMGRFLRAAVSGMAALITSLSPAPLAAQSTVAVATTAQGPRITTAVVRPLASTSDPAPAWAAEGVPRAVWMLAEAASAETDEGVAKALLREAEVEARLSIQQSPDETERRFALAVVLGMRTDREGGGTKVRVASELYETLDDVLRRAPEHARAQHLMGRLHAGVQRMNRLTRFVATRLLGGEVLRQASWSAAERYLAFAEARAPQVSDHHLQLALLYRDTGRPAKALEEIGHVLSLPATSSMENEVRAEAALVREGLEGH